MSWLTVAMRRRKGWWGLVTFWGVILREPDSSWIVAPRARARPILSSRAIVSVLGPLPISAKSIAQKERAPAIVRCPFLVTGRRACLPSAILPHQARVA